ncbi:ribosomal protein S8 [Flexistipes sinusarabici DSM 4947]|uniref:Small ribosomal subunit protein uS8 n=2 Tax=Flexistipes sinusarabici TaxID=2352 RepID=F8E9B3_FLESM|nr:30S ribosomal protein S8 [Flexistipes sinusarabici]AEI14165.1 ribosomal protein S8 [Flexistipes sinusarabici DSM 4947]HCW94068.1 30S ribosomal protein S8 [Flexistipes sinusarabici]
MVMTDPVSDMLARIRNANMVNHQQVSLPYSKLKESILEIMKNEGYIKNYRVETENNKSTINVLLKYSELGDPVIKGLKKVSKPGRRQYVKSKNLSPVLGGLGTGIVSTSHGLKTVKDCINEKIGGEYLCQIW